jgi:hypothetical protein
MATAFREGELMARELKSRSFTISNPPLSTVEQVALEHCAQQARKGAAVTQLTLMQAVGSQNTTGGTSAGILGRLESKGYIERKVYQRGVQVCIVATGECTAAPACTVPHWRTITDRAPLPAIHQLRQHDIPLARWIETEARTNGVPIADFLEQLVRRGAQDYRAEQESPL